MTVAFVAVGIGIVLGVTGHAWFVHRRLKEYALANFTAGAHYGIKMQQQSIIAAIGEAAAVQGREVPRA